MDDGTWKIRLHAPPVEGKANRELRKFLAATLGIRPRAVTLTAGESSRTKVVAILGLSLRQVLDRLRTASETQTRG